MKTRISIREKEKKVTLFECEGIPSYQIVDVYHKGEWIGLFHVASMENGETFDIYSPSLDLRLTRVVR